MMRTLILVVIAGLLAGATWFTRPKPVELSAFDDVGELFYPSFTDPLAAAELEVVEFDADNGAAKIFNVVQRNGIWTIPSHYDYPADAAERLADAAGTLVGLRKDVFQTDRIQDHETLSVIDPMDVTARTLSGRGTRVTLRDAAGTLLADYVLGGPVPDKPGMRYVRLPEQKRVYAVEADVQFSTRFADWIETDIISVGSPELREIDIRDYAIDEQSGGINDSGVIQLRRDADEQWFIVDAPDDRAVNRTVVDRLTSSLVRMTITGIRPKPDAVIESLRNNADFDVTPQLGMQLQSRGFFFTQEGRLLANEGEIAIGTNEGIRYVVRFGEVLYGSAEDVSRERDGDAAVAAGVANRFVMLTAEFDDSLLPDRPEQPRIPEDLPEEVQQRILDGHEQQVQAWRETMQSARERAVFMNSQFAPWFYVISAADDAQLQVGLEELLMPAASDD
ncbi:MAG: DUF4340 domain-containing protein [Planctomycetota bacterium]